MKSIELPDYKQQSDAVKERFNKLKQRPVELSTENLGVTFSGKKTVEAIRDVNLSVYNREFLSILGASGCGKSTLIRVLAGFETPTNGSAKIQGKEIQGPGPDRGMVFQSYTLFPWLTAKKNIMFGLELQHGRSSIVESEAMQWLDFVGLTKFADSYPHQLSGGMKQRVAIARALASKPRILLMDEPFGALDSQTRAQMQSHLIQIWKNIDITIIFITHDIDEAVYLSDRIIVLEPNPSRIAEIIENPVARPRSPQQFLTPEFLAVKKRVEDLIHPRHDDKEEQLPVFKLTPTGNEIE